MSYRKTFVSIVLLIIVGMILATVMDTGTSLAKADPTKVILPDEVQPPVDETPIPHCPPSAASIDSESVAGNPGPCDPSAQTLSTPAPTAMAAPAGTTVDMLDFFLPNANYVVTTDKQYVYYHTFTSSSVRGLSGFFILKNNVTNPPAPWQKQDYEEFNYDSNNIYLLRDSSWAANGSNILCNDAQHNGQEAMTVLLRGAYSFNTGSLSSAEQTWNAHRSSEGEVWVPRTMQVGVASASFPVTVMGFSEDNCQVCTAPNTGTSSRQFEVVSLGSKSFPQMAFVEVLRLAILAGPGAGENFYYTRDYGQVAWEKRPDTDPINGAVQDKIYPTAINSGSITMGAVCYNGKGCPIADLGVPNDRWKVSTWDNRSLSGTPAEVRYDAAGSGGFSFNWGNGSCAYCTGVDNFAVRFERQASFSAGSYTFRTRTDDGVRLWVDGSLIIDQWRDMSPTEYTTTRTMTAGWHTIKMEYYENGGGALAELSWSLGGAPSGLPPLHVTAHTGGISSGLWITRCEAGGAQENVWQVNTTVGNDFWVSYQYPENVPSSYHCGTSVSGVYPLIFRTSSTVNLGTWVTQCLPSSPGYKYVFRVETTDLVDGGRYAIFKYSQADSSCP